MADNLLARGAEAKVYSAELLDRKVVIKHREPKKYRVGELDEALRKSRTKNEARIMLRAAEAEVRVPAVLYVSDYEVIMEHLDGALLREKEIPTEQYSEIGSILARLHDAGIAHGDFTPANIIVKEDGDRFAVIDFGLSVFSKDLEEQAIDVFLMEKAIGKQEYECFIEGYKAFGRWEAVLGRVEEIRRRGRYWERGEKEEEGGVEEEENED